MSDFYEKRSGDGFSEEDLQMMPIKDLIEFMRVWLHDGVPEKIIDENV
jgi:hypothetical protein